MIETTELPRSLEAIGLSEKQAQVYAALVELGGAFPSQISEKTRLNRTTVYKILTDLSIKGLINEITKRNKLFYQIENPNRLLRFAKTQVSLAEDRLQKAEKLIPDFEGLYQMLTNKPGIRYFEGVDGVTLLYEDMVASDKKYEMLAWSNAKELERVLPNKFFEDFRRSKERIGITTRGIVPDTDQDKQFNERFFSGYKKGAVPHLRYVIAEQFPFKGEITVYGSTKIAIVNLNKEYLTGLIIEDETIHEMMRMIFELSWKGTAA